MAYYDNYSGRGATQLRKRIQARFYLRLFRHFGLELSSDSHFLEIGPGTGTVAHLVRDAGANYRAIEPNQGLVDMLKGKGFEVELGSCPPILGADESCDFVFCSHLIEHLADPDTVFSFFRESLRLLRPGGKFVIIAPDILRAGNYFWDSDYTHTFPVTVRRIEQLFLDVGFERETCTNITEPFVGNVKFLINALVACYPYSLLQNLTPSHRLRTLIYKIRSTFSQSVFAVGVKPL